MATHISSPAWELHGQRCKVGYSPWGCKRVRHNWGTKQQQNLGVEIFLWAPSFNFLKCILISETAGSHSNSIFNVLGNLYMFSIEDALIYIPIKSVQSFSLCHILATLTFFFFYIMNILIDVRWYLIVVLICISQTLTADWWCGAYFIYLLAICMSSLKKCLFRAFAHF